MSEAPEQFRHAISERVRSIALSLPEATEGSSCVNRAFKAGGKNFAFLGEDDDGSGLRLKLDASIDDVTARAVDQPDRYQVGDHGWTMLRFAVADQPLDADLDRWITESYRLLVPKRVTAALDASA